MNWNAAGPAAPGAAQPNISNFPFNEREIKKVIRESEYNPKIYFHYKVTY